jgi:hypothetical protein
LVDGSISTFRKPLILGSCAKFLAQSEAVKLKDMQLPGDPLVLDDISSDWTVPAHEIVHWLDMGDIYEERFEDGS